MDLQIVRCECGDTSGVACAWIGPAAETVTVEWMPLWLRASHVAAGGNMGRYPLNGAERIRCERSCAERIVEDDHGWAFVVDAEEKR